MPCWERGQHANDNIPEIELNECLLRASPSPSPPPCLVPVNADLIHHEFALCVAARAILRVASTFRIFCLSLTVAMTSLQDIFRTLFRGETVPVPRWAAAFAELLGEGNSIAGLYQQEWYKHAEQLYESKVMHAVKAEEFNMGAPSQDVLKRFVAMVSEVNPQVTNDDMCTLLAFGALNSTYVQGVFRLGHA